MSKQATGIYIESNGAIYCHDHLGATASMTGRDLKGERLYQVTLADCAEDGVDPATVCCEHPSCNASAKELAR
jgi:hypothetical protein